MARPLFENDVISQFIKTLQQVVQLQLRFENDVISQFIKTVDKDDKIKTRKNNIKISGGISGAITDLNSKEAIRHRKLMYEEIRKRTTDVQKISKNTGYNEEIIKDIKNYLFIDKHDLGDRVDRFDPDFTIAQSWDRLTKGQIESHDIILLKHEIMERELVAQGYSQDEAHIITCKKYNYQKEAEKYYDLLKKRKKRK